MVPKGGEREKENRERGNGEKKILSALRKWEWKGEGVFTDGDKEKTNDISPFPISEIIEQRKGVKHHVPRYMLNEGNKWP